jgi:hypothetical protein
MIRSQVGISYISTVMTCSVKHFTIVIHFTWKLKTAHQITVVLLARVTYRTHRVGWKAERHRCQTILLTLQM